jgi:hypothetical protein
MIRYAILMPNITQFEVLKFSNFQAFVIINICGSRTSNEWTLRCGNICDNNINVSHYILRLRDFNHLVKVNQLYMVM